MLPRSPLRWLGWLLIVLGVLFAAQGYGAIRWPADSFMIDQRPWIAGGIAFIVFGVIVLVADRRRPRR